jgi:hypothetical protein
VLLCKLFLGARLLLAPSQIIPQGFGQSLGARGALGAGFCGDIRRLGHAPMQREGYDSVKPRLILDADLCVRVEDYGHRALGGVFPGLIGMLTPPGVDTRAVTFHRGAPSAARRLEGLQYSSRGGICLWIVSLYPPNHWALQKLRLEADATTAQTPECSYAFPPRRAGQSAVMRPRKGINSALPG